MRVAFEDEDVLRVASLPKQLERLSLVPGDLVRTGPLDDERLVVSAREPRDSQVVRRTKGGRTKTMAANVDALAIVAAFAHPPLYRAMLDELLAFAQLQELAAFAIFTKPDLVEPSVVAATVALYGTLAKETLVVHGLSGEGTAALAEALAGRRTLIVGQSGVGKSTLSGRLGGEGDVGELSRFGRGRQTTSSGRLHRLRGGFLIDSPGVGEFALDGVAPAELAAAFVDFRPHLGRCRFTDCRHAREPGCAIREAMRTGSIAESRFASYHEILARADR